MAVADAAFVLVVVEREAVELIDDRAIGLARGAGESGEHHVDLVALKHAPHEFLVARIVRLGVVDHQFKFAPGNAAGSVDLVGGELNAMHLSDGRQREVAGLVLQDAELDRVLRERRA